MSNLKEAISYIYDMEKSNYLLTRAIFSVTQLIHKPRVHKEIKVNTKGLREPQAPAMPHDWPTPLKPYYKREKFDCGWGAWLTVSAIAVFVLVVIIAAIATGLDTSKLEGTGELVVGFGYVIGFLLCVLLRPILEIISGRIDYRKRCKDYQKEMTIYEKMHMNYEEELKAYDLDYAKYKSEYREYKKEYDIRYNAAKKADDEEYNARKNALNLLLTQLTNKLAQSVSLLNEMYNAVGIDHDYRNIVPVAYMNEFVRLGIATKLEGADGLYYLVRKELQTETMNQKLDVIVAKMDTIIDKQHALYSELVSMNFKCDNMISASISQTDAILAQNNAINQQNNLISDQNMLISKVQNDTAVAAYNSERMAREQEYMNYFQRYDRW